ncbi:putative lipase YDL109C [Trichomonascus vanleenenianus]|uniref:lipase ROG1 family protein n=1 Tax=Trichomonascus vanleenenianus TaxID=2268995 RepID=UPI003EC9B867
MTGLVTKQVLYRTKSRLKVGELNRFVVTYTPDRDSSRIPGQDTCLWLRIKNTEAMPLRAAYLAGPYILYVDVRPGDYDQNRNVFSTADQPVYEPQLKAAQSFYAQLYMYRFQEVYTWTIDVVSQIIFSQNASVQFELMIGHEKDDLHSSLPVIGSMTPSGIHVQKYETLDLWNTPSPDYAKPVHLVVVTHGLHSNTGADLLYLKERIDETARREGKNIIVRGYFGNVCKTEKGVKYLGRRLGDYIMKELVPKNGRPFKVTEISFIGHSLGGLVQTFAIAHIQHTDPKFFERIRPANFVTLATPYLGLSNENPGYVKFALDIGFAGRTGQDLGLTWKPSKKKHHKPLLEILPTGPTHVVLQKFKRRTLYANAVNDGIVPLRTSAILYLDWRGIAKAAQAKRGEKVSGSSSPTEHHRNEEGKKFKRNYTMGSLKSKSEKSESSASGSSSENLTTRKGSTSSEKDLTATSLEDQEEDKPSMHSVKEADEDDEGGSATGEIPEDPSLAEVDKSHENPVTKAFTKAPMEVFNAFAGPLSSLMSYVAPQAGGKRPGKIYQRSQTVDPADYSKAEEGEHHDESSTLPKKTSMLESGVSVLLPPLPPLSFIVDPATRPSSIFHDRLYSDRDLPARRYSRKTSFLSPITPKSLHSNSNSNSSDPNGESSNSDGKVEKAKVEERIARDWHKGLIWRKVLVSLEPDAHNNIVVRRRFANAYGWPVIDHLVESHFGPGSETPLRQSSHTPKLTGVDVLRSSKFSRNRNVGENLPFNVPTTSSRSSPKASTDSDQIDLSSLAIDTTTPDEIDHPVSLARASTSDSVGTAAAWETHLRSRDDGTESEEEGIVHNVGLWIDNLRDIGSLNLNSFVDAKRSDVDTNDSELLEEVMEGRPPTY